MLSAYYPTQPGRASAREFLLPPILKAYWLALVVLSAISAAASDIYYKLDLFQQCCTLAYDDPLFTDLWSYHYLFRYIHTSAFFTSSQRFAYPAFSAVLYDLIYHLGRHSQAIYLTTELLACGFAAYSFFRRVSSIGMGRLPAVILVLCTLLFSYPLLLLFETGNIEIFTCILSAAGLWAMLKGHDRSAAALWGAAAAMKIYPILLLGVFLSRAKWRSLATGVASFALISFLSMWFVGPTIPIAFAGSLSGVTGFVSTYAEKVRTQELPLDHSLLAPIKIVAFVMAHRTGSVSYLTKPYILTAGIAALLAFFLRARLMPVTNQIVFLFAAMVALPPVSYDYTLVHLYAVWAMLVVIALRAYHARLRLPGLRTCFFCFAVLFTSQRFIFYHWIHPNGTFKAIALVLLMATALRFPISDVVLDETFRRSHVEFREPHAFIPAAQSTIELREVSLAKTHPSRR